MKLNIDCVRDVLLQCENIPLDGHLLFKDLSASLPDYSEDDIQYSCRTLFKDDCISCVIKKYKGSNIIISQIRDITPKGHELLNTLRSNSFFSKLKRRIENVVISSIPELVSIIAELLG